MPRLISIINTGVANIASVQSAFSKLGYETRFVESPTEILDNPAVILPGVGAFEAGMSALNSLGYSEALKQRIESGKATLSVCLGMQLLCEASEESPCVTGLGIIPATIRRFGEGIRVPHFGWNQVSSDESFLGSGYAYFANSFRLETAPEGWEVATCDHGGEFIAAARRGNVIAAQFHPEISSNFGRHVLETWLEGVRW